MPRILSTHTLHPRASAMLAGAGELVVASALDPDTLASEARNADIVIVRAPLPPAAFRGCLETQGGDPPWRRARHDPDGSSHRRRRAGGQRTGGQCALGCRTCDVRGPCAASPLPHGRPRLAREGLARRPRARQFQQRACRQDDRHRRPRRRRPGRRPYRRARLRPEGGGNDAQHAAGAGQGRLPVDRRAGRAERHHRSVLPADAGDARPDQPRTHRPHEAQCAADQRVARTGRSTTTR